MLPLRSKLNQETHRVTKVLQAKLQKVKMNFHFPVEKLKHILRIFI